MATRPYPILTVNEKAARAIRAGHPWVYGVETTGPDRPCENGDLVDVVSLKSRWLGTGLLNDHSKIRVRLLSRNTNDRFDEAFWRRRLQYALDYRKTVMGDDFSCARLIFGEADQFPGLTVDLFGDILVTEVLSLGMEVRKSPPREPRYPPLTGSPESRLATKPSPPAKRKPFPLPAAVPAEAAPPVGAVPPVGAAAPPSRTWWWPARPSWWTWAGASSWRCASPTATAWKTAP